MEMLKLVQQQQIGLNQQALDEWREYRESKKKPLSQFALNKVVNFLLKFSEDHQQHIVDQAIMNDWAGLHAVEMPQQQSRKTTINDDLNDRSWA
jgi:hypothetical protein